VECYPARSLLGVALLFFSVGGCVGLISGHVVGFLLGYSVLALGVGAGLSTLACMAIIADVFPEHRGKLSGGLLAIYGLSAMVSAPLFHGLSSMFTWKQTHAVITIGYAALAWIAWFALPSDKKISTGSSATFSATLGWQEKKQLVLNIFLISAATVSGMAFSNGEGRFLGGVLADVVPESFDKLCIFSINALAYLILLLANQSNNPQLLAGYPWLVGLAFGALAGNLPSIARQIAPSRPHSVFGILFGTFALGRFAGPLFSSLIELQITLRIFGILSCLACLITFIEWFTLRSLITSNAG